MRIESDSEIQSEDSPAPTLAVVPALIHHHSVELAGGPVVAVALAQPAPVFAVVVQAHGGEPSVLSLHETEDEAIRRAKSVAARLGQAPEAEGRGVLQ